MKRGVIVIALLLVALLVSCGTPAQQEIPDDAVRVTIRDFKFIPPEVKVKEGQSIVWVNEDTASHTATAKNNEFTTSELFKGQSGVAKMDKKGAYEYYCAIHPGMKGKIIVE